MDMRQIVRDQGVAKTSPAGGACIFCGNPHVVIRSMVPNWADALLTHQAVGGRPNLASEHWLTCASCAEGWMAALAERARPVLAPLLTPGAAASPPITAAQQQDVSGWLCLTTMLAASLHQHCVIPRGDRSQLRHTGRPPRNWAMFVAALSGTTWTGACLHEPCRIEFSGNPSATPARGGPINPACNTQLLSVGIGPMFLHTLSTPSWPLLEDFATMSRAAGLVPLWPVHRRFGMLRDKMRLPPDNVLECGAAGRIADEAAAYLRTRLGQPGRIRTPVTADRRLNSM